jgi:hypothetical protein
MQDNLYHLGVPDVFGFVERMHETAERLLIVDTHTACARRTEP